MKKNSESIKPGYKMTPLGAIPEDWEVKRLKEICLKFLNGGTPSTDNTEFWGGSIPWITGADIVEGEITIRKKISESAVRKNTTNVIPSGNLLIVTRTGVGKIARTNFPIAISQDLTGLIIDNKIVNLQYLFQTMNFSQSNLKKLNQGTSISGITRNVLQNISICLPPLPEQVTVAKVLSTWDEAIEKTRLLIEQKELRKKALMQQLLTGKKRLKGFSGDWKEYNYGDILEEIERPTEWDDDFLYQLISVKRRSGGIFKRLALKGDQILVKNLRGVEVGDFIFSKMQIVHGASALVTKEFEGSFISGSYIAIISRNPQILNIEFFNWYSKMPVFYHQTYISSYGVHIEKMTFNFEFFLSLKMSLPSIEEQKAIADVLQKANLEIELEKQKLEQLKLQKKGLMQVLLTGRKRINYKKEAKCLI